MSIASRPLTYDDLLAARESGDERLRLELIAGEIVVTPSPAPMHQIVLRRLLIALDREIGESGAGEVLMAPLDVYLDEFNTLQPDLLVLLRDRQHLLGSARIEAAPSLAAEILSPSTSGRDRIVKRDLYARFGVPEYWVVDPAAGRVTIYGDLREGRYHQERTASDVAISVTMPGLSVDLGKLFAPPLPA